MSNVDYQSSAEFCPHCEDVRTKEDFEFLGLVVELGNIPRFRCKVCGKTFETLPPSIVPEHPNEPRQE